MAGTILTPVAIWRNFKIDQVPTATALYEKRENSVIYTGVRINGRKTKDGQVGIFAELAKAKSAFDAPAILLVKDIGRNSDEKLVEKLVKQGFVVLSVDIGGLGQNKEYYTEYPESLSYANFQNVKDTLREVKKGANETCWYEWTVAVRYALSFFKNMIGIGNVGGLGLGRSATVMWQVAGTDENLDCVVFALDSGWRCYRGTHKFGGVEPQFSDDVYKYIAGIEPEAYASHVKCPVLMLSATNSNEFDVDRAYDTINRTNEEIYTAVHYSVGNTDNVASVAYENAVTFFKNYLVKDKKVYLAGEIDVKGEIVEGKFLATVTPDKKDLKEIVFYVAEGMADPALRSWNKITLPVEIKNGVYTFEYKPYHQSGIVTFFASATYKSGFSVCSAIQAKRFEPEEIAFAYKSKIIYSSRIPNAESTFFAESGNDVVNVDDNNKVVKKKGPMGMEGVSVKNGVVTFKMITEKDKPQVDSMLIFDLYSPENTEYTVSLIADYFGERVEYFCTGSIYGGDIWHNIKLNRNRFKTAEGMPLKNYEKIQALKFKTEKDGLINNALWV